MDDRETHPAGTSGPYKPDSDQHQIDFYKLREGLALDHNMKLQDEIKDLRAHLLSERRQKDAAQARADLAEKRLAAAKAELTRANAAAAAAYEVAAVVKVLSADNVVLHEHHPVMEYAIRALATPDQTAALDKLIAEAVKPWTDMAQECIALTQHPETTWDLPARLVRRMNDAILAASKKGGV